MRKSRGAFWEFIGDNLIPLATVLAGVLAIALQMLGKLSDSDMLLVVLGLLCLLATQEIVERSKRLGRIEDRVQQILESLAYAGLPEKIQILHGSNEWYRYVTARMLSARKSIDDSGLTPRFWGLVEDSVMKDNYYTTCEKIIAAGQVRYRHIVMFYDKGRFERVEKYITQYGAAKNYFAAYYPVNLQKVIPLLSVLIIDNEEVVVGVYYSAYFPGGEQDYAFVIRQPDIVRLFADYYNLLWRAAIKLNDVRGCNLSALEEIRRQLSEISRVIEDGDDKNMTSVLLGGC